MAHRYNRFQRGTRFIDLPRHRRADKVFKLKHRIRNNEYNNFYTHDVLDNGVSWTDVDFLGRDKFTFWNATIVTAADARNSIAETQAHDIVDAALENDSARKVEQEIRSFMNRDNWIKLPNGCSQWNPPPAVHYEQFEGRTYHEQLRHVQESLRPDVFEEIKKDFSYSYGIGLHVTLDVPLLTVEVIESFIDRFVQDERPFRATTPAVHVDAKVFHSNAIKMD